MEGGGTDPESANTGGDGDTHNTPVKVEKNAKAQLGVLSKAMVKIYELGTSPHKLLFTEITSDGDTVDSIGNFNAHEKELKSDKIYLYEVHGGNDMDVDDDGVVDNSPTVNEGIFRAVVQGSDVKSLGGKFKVTAVSEIQYKKVEEHIDNIAVLREKLQEAPKLIIKDDLNNDGKIDAKDILLYDPVEHEEKLEKVYKDKLEKIVDDIHKKDTEIDVSIAPKLEGNTFILAENATSGNKVGQIEILDNGQAPITEFKLKGEGSSKFKIDEKGVIKVNALSVLSLKTLKVYNLKAVATNRIGESNEADVRINIIQIDEVAPVFISDDSLIVTENSFLNHIVEVTDDSSVSFTLEGADSKFFNFNQATKKLTFNQSLDFENPKDENADNVYEVNIKAIDSAGNFAIQNISVTISSTDTNKSKIIGAIKTDFASNITLSTDETKAYVADGFDGIKIIDIQDTSNLTNVGSIDTNLALNITLSPDGTQAYVADDDEIKIIDVSKPANPVKVAFIFTHASSIAISKDKTKAYIADDNIGLKIININNITNEVRTYPIGIDSVKIGSVDIQGGAGDVILSKDGTKAYVANGSWNYGGLNIIDVSNPVNPTLISSIENKNTTGVTFSPDGTKAYIIGYDFKIIDINDASSPITLGSIHIDNAINVTLSPDGTKAYVTVRDEGLKIFDVRDATNPTLIDSIDTNSAYGIKLSSDGTKAYVASGSDGIKVIDISQYNEK